MKKFTFIKLLIPLFAFVCVNNLFSQCVLQPQTVQFCPGETVNLTSLETMTGTYEYYNQKDLLYITNFNGNSVSVIDATTNTLVTNISTGPNPYGMTFSPDGLTAYVANHNGSSISIIDVLTNTVVGSISVGVNPLYLAFSPDETLIYITNAGSDNISIIDASSNAVVGTIAVGDVPGVLQFSPDGNLAYVTNTGDSNVMVIDLVSNTVIATIPVGPGPFGLVITPDGNFVYAVSINGNSVSVIDTNTNTVIATVPVGATPIDATITPDGNFVYVTNTSANTVSVIDASTNTIVATIPVGNGPFGVNATSDGNFVYVTNSGSDNIGIIDVNTNTMTTTIPVGDRPFTLGDFSTSINVVGTLITGETMYQAVDGETVMVVFTDAFGCSDTSTIDLIVTPNIDFNETKRVCAGNALYLVDVDNAPNPINNVNLTYNWYLVVGLPDNASGESDDILVATMNETSYYSPTQIGTYWAEVISSSGCITATNGTALVVEEIIDCTNCGSN